jgi:hypothetical protein
VLSSGLKEFSAVASEVVAEGARMLRFLAPTADWKTRIGRRISLPSEWPLILVEILHAEDGRLLMTCALGVPKSAARALLSQGAYVYEFDELPAAIVDIMDAHFTAVENNMAKKLDSLLPAIRPRLVLVKK